MLTLAVPTELPSSTEIPRHMTRPHSSRGPVGIKYLSMADSTVQYLHRTVKDFLEDGKVWTALISPRKAAFDPHIALCRAYITHLKLELPRDLNIDFFWPSIRRCLLQAYRCEEFSEPGTLRKQLVPMLSELDRALTEMHADQSLIPRLERYDRFVTYSLPLDFVGALKNDDQDTLYLPHWVYRLKGYIVKSSIGPDSWHSLASGGSFLSLAIKLRLHSFVEAKLRPGCLEKQKDGIWPLLADAICEPPTIHASFGIHEFPSVNMVRLLLSNGADPNYRCDSKTVWESMWSMLRVHWSLEHFDRSSPAEELVIARRWLPIIAELLDHGANSSVIPMQYLRRLLTVLRYRSQEVVDKEIVDRIEAKQRKSVFSYEFWDFRT